MKKFTIDSWAVGAWGGDAIVDQDTQQLGSPMGPHRVNIINTLQLIASPAAQAEYQRRATGVNVATELVNQWFDDFYHPGFSQFDAEFSSYELATLQEFHQRYEGLLWSLPDSLAEMLASATWSEVVASAQNVLGALAWTGVEAKYDR